MDIGFWDQLEYCADYVVQVKDIPRKKLTGCAINVEESFEYKNETENKRILSMEKVHGTWGKDRLSSKTR